MRIRFAGPGEAYAGMRSQMTEKNAATTTPIVITPKARVVQIGLVLGGLLLIQEPMAVGR